MNNCHYFSAKVLSISDLQEIIAENKSLELSEEAKINITKCRDYLDIKLLGEQLPIYGINTGFGSLCNVQIPPSEILQLQENLVKSHACGTGAKVPNEIVKLMLLLKIQSLSYGYSGVQLQTVSRLIDFYNNDILPIVFELGSLGASGDLAPLAHLSLPLLGEGNVSFDGKIISANEVLSHFDWKPISLQSKEGLALLNGTQFMSAYGVYILVKASRISYMADLIGAISLDGFDGLQEAFHDAIHIIRPHKGQVLSARRITSFIEGSQIISKSKPHVQDPYSFRCMPQVHGASADVLDYAKKVFKTEINSVTDNPNIFYENDEILSGGNFHGQPLALALDFLSIALSEWGSISERRTFQLISGLRGLPAFLTNNPGLHSGLMIPQYTAASIASQNKQLASPASTDSIVSSNGQEDHVSMGANAATKCLRIMENVERIYAIELLTAAQAIEFRRPLKSSIYIEKVLDAYRREVPFIDKDRILYNDIAKSVAFLNDFIITETIFD